MMPKTCKRLSTDLIDIFGKVGGKLQTEFNQIMALGEDCQRHEILADFGLVADEFKAINFVVHPSDTAGENAKLTKVERHQSNCREITIHTNLSPAN